MPNLNLTKKRSRRQKNLNVEINITPLVDVMLVLVVVLLICIPTKLTSNVNINLPQAGLSTPSDNNARSVQLMINGAQQVMLDGVECKNLVNLRTMLQNLCNNKPDISVLVKADKNLSYECIMQILGLVKNVGITKVNLVTQRGK